MIYIVVSTLKFFVSRTACVVASAVRSTTVVTVAVCAAEAFHVYVSYSATSEAIGHVSMTSATAIERNGRDLVVRTIASELDDMY